MVKSLIPAQRHDRIQALLDQQRVASISELSDLLQVSEATIRRDLEALEEQGALERTHGGAILTRRLPNEPFYSTSATQHPDEKREIGAAAAQLVAEGETLFINSGTTTRGRNPFHQQRDDHRRGDAAPRRAPRSAPGDPDHNQRQRHA